MTNYRSLFGLFRPIHLWPLVLVVVGIGACFTGAVVAEAYWELLGLLLLLSLAAMLCGLLTGFLFGIPRLNRNYDSTEKENSTTRYMPNTNLEDVSDWLTKIIIGVTLTQLTKIPGYLDSIADNILMYSNCEEMNCHYAVPIIISLLIYFFITGFTGGYYYTRLFLPNLFVMMEDYSIKSAEIAIWRAGSQKIQQGDGVVASVHETANLTEEEKQVLQKIAAQNNLQTGSQRLSHREIAAINVLVAKGILRETPDSSSRRIGSLLIADEDILRSLL